MEQKNRIEQIMNSAIEKLKGMVDSNTVVGEPISTPNGFVIPLTKVCIGFVAGGGEYSAGEKQIKTINNYPFAGGSGSGVSVQPIGFLCVEGSKINLIKVDGKTPLEKLIDNIPKVTEAITNAIKENKCEKNKNYTADTRIYIYFFIYTSVSTWHGMLTKWFLFGIYYADPYTNKNRRRHIYNKCRVYGAYRSKQWQNISKS